ncbi:hypothetical protein DICVIV_09813 [Dictyocaulus viviparus]|uniref:Uncharacterized protein n=1 Tax=Dictyocaulus viviparus TaxID=29172 RepID=A0A0D8XHR6_DICVI|nr:hypothetical protein DICVIV_09813 [Dictyocaulus viviparus]
MHAPLHDSVGLISEFLWRIAQRESIGVQNKAILCLVVTFYFVKNWMACYVDHQLFHFLEGQLPYIRRRFIYGLGNMLVNKIWSGHRALQQRILHMRDEQTALERALYQNRRHYLSTLQQDSQIEEKLLEHDNYIITVLDDYFKRQQWALTEMMIPGFFITDNPIDIEVQILILDFIAQVRLPEPYAAPQLSQQGSPIVYVQLS